MFTQLCRVLPGLLLACLPFMLRAQPCSPPSFCGIVCGISLDADVVLLHGPGFFDEHLGHVGGRYYTDSTMSMTMVVSIGTDNYIEEVEIMQGLAFPDNAPKDLRPYISKRFWEHDNGRLRARLGATREQVRKAFGEPTEVNDERSYWDYANDPGACHAFVSTSFVFIEDKVARVAFYNGD